MADPKRFYRLLLKFYPARFREEYETPLEQQFWDDYRNQPGSSARLAFWLHVVKDLAISIPAEILSEIWQDLRCSARAYRHHPLSTMLALSALALAIGVTTGVFSVLSALLLRGLPFREPERLVQISMFSNLIARDGVKNWGLRSSYLAGTAEYASAEMTLGQVAEPVRVKVTEASSNFFSVLGVEPAFGRAFVAGEDVSGRGTVAVIGHGLWRQIFAGDPRILGSTIRLNGAPLTVVGVVPPGLDYPARTGVWTATINAPLPRPAGIIDEAILGRLKPGIGTAQAQAMFLDEVRHAYPESIRQLGLRISRLRPLRDELVGPVRQAFAVLLGAAAFVLMIACANVALLLLSRTTERRQELAIRAALGASRARLVQQLVTEAIALTLAGATAGLLVAPWATRLAANAQPAPLAAQAYTILDWRVLGFAVVVAVLTGVLFGVLPALLIGRMQPSHEVIRSQPGGAGASRLRIGLIAAQAALTLVLLAGSITLGRSFLRLLGTDLGFQTDRVVSMTVSLAGTPYAKTRETQFYNDALDRLRAVPGVEAAGAVKYLPLVESDWHYLGGSFRIDSGEVVEGNIVVNAVTSGYFKTMGTNIVAGRDFTAADGRGKELVAIVNEAFARRIGPVASVVGRRATRSYTATFAPTYTIVGVVRTFRLGGPASAPPLQVYLPVEERPPGAMTFVARVRGNAANYIPACRSALQQVDRGIPVYDVKTLQQRLDEVLARPRFYATAILFLAAFALLLAVIGIYGVATYSITQRTHEMGVRIAVGATPARLRTTLVRQSMAPVLVGVTAGVLGAAGLGKYLQHLIPSEPLGMRTCLIAGLVLSATAWTALWFATSRVIDLNPMITLKTE